MHSAARGVVPVLDRVEERTKVDTVVSAARVQIEAVDPVAAVHECGIAEQIAARRCNPAGRRCGAEQNVRPSPGMMKPEPSPPSITSTPASVNPVVTSATVD